MYVTTLEDNHSSKSSAYSVLPIRPYYISRSEMFWMAKHSANLFSIPASNDDVP